MKRFLRAACFITLAAAVCLSFAGCRESDAIWLEDGQTLSIVDNTLGEGEKLNIKIPYSYTNSVENEENGHVYILPVSETNPSVRYFTYINQGTTTAVYLSKSRT